MKIVLKGKRVILCGGGVHTSKEVETSWQFPLRRTSLFLGGQYLDYKRPMISTVAGRRTEAVIIAMGDM